MPTRRAIASLATLLAILVLPPAARAQSPAADQPEHPTQPAPQTSTLSSSVIPNPAATFADGVEGSAVSSSADPPEHPKAHAPVYIRRNHEEASQPYHRPTEKQKLRTYAFDAFGPYVYAGAAFSAGLGQAHNAPREWGQGADAFGVRMASNFGVALVTTTVHYGLAEALREDTAYYRCDCTGLLPRLEHALASTLMGRRGNDGHAAFSFSSLAAPYAGTTIAMTTWYPRRFGPSDGFRAGNYALLGQATQNLALEFIYGGPHTLLGRIRFPGLSGRKKDAKSSPPDPSPSQQ